MKISIARAATTVAIVAFSVGCASSTKQPAASADAAIPATEGPGDPQSDGGFAVSDGGGSTAAATDAGTDAGLGQAMDGGTLGGSRLACSPSGELTLVWSLQAFHDRWRNDYYQTFEHASSDTVGGVLVYRGGSAGHGTYWGWFTVDADGGSRIADLPGGSCMPTSPCIYEGWVAVNGLLFGSHGVVRSAMDGSYLAAWDQKVAAEAADAGPYPYPSVLAADDRRSVFAFTNRWAGTDVHTLLTEIGLDGGTVWQRTFEHGFPIGLALDEGGTTHVAFHDVHVALAADGRTLFTAPMPPDGPSSYHPFNAGGGRVYNSERTLLDARDGHVALMLPFQPEGPAILTAERILVREMVAGGSGPLVAFDVASKKILWKRDMGRGAYDSSFTTAGRLVLVVDTQRVLHFVQPDGTDALACQIDADAPGVLLPGRLVIARRTSLDAYDLPVPLGPK
jgi:hypothetical protein